MSGGWVHSHSVSMRIQRPGSSGAAKRIGQGARLRGGVRRGGTDRAWELDVQAAR
jgi:hypothetical protein